MRLIRRSWRLEIQYRRIISVNVDDIARIQGKGPRIQHDCMRATLKGETVEKCSVLLKVKPPAHRAYAPVGTARIIAYFAD